MLTQGNMSSIDHISDMPIEPLMANGSNYHKWYVLMTSRLDRFYIF